MEGFEWAENNLGVDNPQALLALGVNVFFAPHISPEVKVVSLATGQVAWFQHGQERPDGGYYASFTDLERFCYKTGRPFAETNGQLTIHLADTDEADNQLRHEGH